VELLLAIKHSMHETIRAEYPYVSMMDAWSSLINVRQQPEEKLMDYIKRFKQIRYVLTCWSHKSEKTSFPSSGSLQPHGGKKNMSLQSRLNLRNKRAVPIRECQSCYFLVLILQPCYYRVD
jgi:hypothetical protein